MRYVSTRGRAPVLDFEGALLAGLATDGGLYVPEAWPQLSEAAWQSLAGRSYAEMAAALMQPFIGEAIEAETFEALVRDAYAGFDHAAVAPLVQLGPALWLLELVHGPTLAFKDYALQLVGRLFEYVLARRGERITIVGATSGDTGAAAIEACRDKPSMTVFILHPKDRISDVQRRQMTTVAAANVHNIAVEGTFDDCQALVKAMFGDQRLRERLRLSAVNSINWARVMAQVVYYAHAALSLGAPGRAVSFVVPTGNFGNVFAAYAASRMGLPIQRLMVATNRNDIVARFFQSGEYRSGQVTPTMSPSMDIQVSSNFERLLFELMDRDGTAVERLMQRFQQSGGFEVAAPVLARARAAIQGVAVSETATLARIARLWQDCGIVVDPHTAVGLEAAAGLVDGATPVVSLATAHPAKFPDAVEKAIGHRPTLPGRLADLMQRPEHCAVLPNDLATVSTYIESRAG